MTERHLLMPSTVEFPFSDDEELPRTPIALSYAGLSISAHALLDTGSTVNLLPYDIGLQLGVVWEEQTFRLPLAGNLAKVEARGLFLHVQIGNLERVRLAFAWAQVSEVPLILGQTNFFREFDVCFQRSRRTIEIIRF
jgi:hypothetical protein